MELLELSIQLLKEERWIIKRLLNNFKIKEYKAKINKLNADKNLSIRNIQTDVENKQKEIEFRKNNRDLIVEDQCKDIKDEIVLMEHILVSPELAGAIAELELIEWLQKLPDNFYVVNNIKLERYESIRFDGEWLTSAQIDHLVIAPSGIFVIETKSWSREFSEQGNYFDPYQQVKRSSYMCYKFLEDKLQGAKVRSIIAYKGSIPNKLNDSYAKVLKLHEVNGYILWFREKVLDDKKCESIAKLLNPNSFKEH